MNNNASCQLVSSWSHDLPVCTFNGAYLRDDHKNRLEQQGKLEASAQPEKTPSDIGNQPDGTRHQRVVQMAVQVSSQNRTNVARKTRRVPDRWKDRRV